MIHTMGNQALASHKLFQTTPIENYGALALAVVYQAALDLHSKNPARASEAKAWLRHVGNRLVPDVRHPRNPIGSLGSKQLQPSAWHTPELEVLKSSSAKVVAPEIRFEESISTQIKYCGPEIFLGVRI